jgi:hypothetical protein
MPKRVKITYFGDEHDIPIELDMFEVSCAIERLVARTVYDGLVKEIIEGTSVGVSIDPDGDLVVEAFMPDPMVSFSLKLRDMIEEKYEFPQLGAGFYGEAAELDCRAIVAHLEDLAQHFRHKIERAKKPEVKKAKKK